MLSAQPNTGAHEKKFSVAQHPRSHPPSCLTALNNSLASASADVSYHSQNTTVDACFIGGHFVNKSTLMDFTTDFLWTMCSHFYMLFLWSFIFTSFLFFIISPVHLCRIRCHMDSLSDMCQSTYYVHEFQVKCAYMYIQSNLSEATAQRMTKKWSFKTGGHSMQVI